MDEGIGIREREILRFIARRNAQGEGSPSVREMAEAVGVRSSRTAHVYLLRLEEGRYIVREGGRARSVRLTRRGWEVAGEVSLMGRAAAGRGLEAIASPEAYPLVETILFSGSGGGRYLLEVVGQSMIEAGIEDGDVLVVEEDESPPDGVVVVALLREGEEVTVKRLYREGALVRLVPANGAYEEILVGADDIRIQGRVVYVIHPPRV